MRLASTVRMSTPITPVMDNCWLDTYFFFVPARLCWNRWEEFNGENPRGNWTDDSDPNIRIPKCAFHKDCEMTYLPESGFYQHNDTSLLHVLEGTLIDYFGLPYLNMKDWRGTPAAEGYPVTEQTNCFSLLPFEAYNLIWNNFFRDQNLQDPVELKLQNTSMSDSEAVDGIYAETNEVYNLWNDELEVPYWDTNNKNRQYFQVKRAGKMHDYFTSCLPQPQKHAPIVIPGFDRDLNVVTSSATHDQESTNALTFSSSNGTLTGNGFLAHKAEKMFSASAGNVSPTLSSPLIPNNLVVDVGGSLPNINDLRVAFALQKLFETDAIGGTRYTELLYSHFGVLSDDARLQIPEYLGGDRIPINMEQVVQTSESNTTPQGNASGLSLTNNVGNSFFKSFTEHGYIIGLAVVRPQHSYQNGINRMWLRDERFDFYYPELANIGEQPVNIDELCAGISPSLKYTFGYQEAWAEYRYKPNMVTGKMRSLLPDSLDIWHYGDAYTADASGFDTNPNDPIIGTPVLSDAFVSETGRFIDRTLAVSSQLEPQFFGDFYFKCAVTRPMPLYSVPGLVDKH